MILAGQTKTLSVQCDTCHRQIKLIDDTRTISNLGACVITSGCTGSMFKITNQSEARRAQAIPPTELGIQDWTQRKVLVDYTQPFSSKEWTITHNLGTYPTVFVYNKLHAQIFPKEIIPVDGNTVILKFDDPEIGRAQILSSSSRYTVADQATDSPTLLQLTSHGELTIATLSNNDFVDVTMVFEDTTTNETFEVEYRNIGVASVTSPWVASKEVVITGKYYKVRSFNLRHDQLTTDLINSGRIPAGSQVSVHINTPDGVRSNVILLSRSPYTIADRNTNNYVDLHGIKSSIIYSNAELLLDETSSNIKQVYPPIVSSTALG